MSDYIMFVVLIVSCAILGNHIGDDATLRDCATVGVAKMAGGGAIRCDVIKKEQP